MVRKVLENNVLRDMTAEEEADASQRETDFIARRTANEEAKAKNIADKASAKAKLIAGEALTEDEADTIVL